MAEKLNESTVTLETSDGSMEAFQVIPDGEMPAPAVIIAHNVSGHRSAVRRQRSAVTTLKFRGLSQSNSARIAELKYGSIINPLTADR